MLCPCTSQQAGQAWLLGADSCACVWAIWLKVCAPPGVPAGGDRHSGADPVRAHEEPGPSSAPSSSSCRCTPTCPARCRRASSTPHRPARARWSSHTNIAEASLTIDGIYYVVDPGFAKQKVRVCMRLQPLRDTSFVPLRGILHHVHRLCQCECKEYAGTKACGLTLAMSYLSCEHMQQIAYGIKGPKRPCIACMLCK